MDKIELQSILTWYGSGKLKDVEAIELICALANKAKNEQSKCNIPPVSGLACKCGNQTFTHRHSNWIECTACNKIQILQD